MVTVINESEFHALTGGSLSDLVGDEARQRRYGVRVLEVEQWMGEPAVVKVSHAAPLELRVR